MKQIIHLLFTLPEKILPFHADLSVEIRNDVADSPPKTPGVNVVDVSGNQLETMTWKGHIPNFGKLTPKWRGNFLLVKYGPKSPIAEMRGVLTEEMLKRVFPGNGKTSFRKPLDSSCS